jgi:hypothetical protein
MEQALALNLFSDPGFSGESVKTRSPEKIGEGLFRSLLLKQDKEISAPRRKDIENELQHLGLPVEMNSLGPGAGRMLVSYLKGHGMTENDADSLVKASIGEDGFIQLNRLMMAIDGLKEATSENQSALMVTSRDVPRFQEFLFEMGLGVSQVKALFEQGNDGKGNIIVSRIFAALSPMFADAESPEELVTLLSRYGIECRPTDPAQQIGSSDVQAFMETYAETSSEDVQKRIKAVLAGVLREKGVPPEEVKSFLEGMSIEYARKVSGFETTTGAKNPGAAELGLWGGIVLKPLSEVENNPGTEKILAILKDVQAGAKQSGGRMHDNSLPFAISTESIEKVGSQDASVAEKGTALLHAEKVAALSGSHRKQSGNASDSRLSLSPENTASVGSGPRAGVEHTIRTVQQAGSLGRTAEYTQLTSTIPAVLDRMQWMVKAGSQEARIQLSPPELGHIDLRLVIEHGHVQAHLSAENPLVKGMIESNLGQLKEQLVGLGFVVDAFSVHVGGENGRSGNEDELWERSAGVGRLRGKGNAQSAISGDESRAGHILTDNRYQINLQV